jgi:hypothetical protein
MRCIDNKKGGVMGKWMCLVVFAIAAPAAAEPDVRYGVESFRWSEYDADGSRLLTESGQRYFVGAEWQRPFGPDPGQHLELQATGYLGNVDYDGQACTLLGDCVAFTTDTFYGGVRGDALVVQRSGTDQGVEIFGGGGIDFWRRSIRGRASVQGAIEDWMVFYVVAGGGAYKTDASTRIHARAGVKLPFYTHELPDTYDITLNPEGEMSLFARLSFDFLVNGQPRWGLGVHYDSYRFGASDMKRTGPIVVWQPESRQDTFGIFGTWYLN